MMIKMIINIIQLLFFCGFLLVNDSYSQVGFIKDSIPGDCSSIDIDNPKFQVRLVGSIFEDYPSDKSVKYKYFNKKNDTSSSCSYNYRSTIDSIQIKVNYNPKSVRYSRNNCYIVVVETYNGEQIYFKDGIEFIDNLPISLIPNDFKYKIIEGVKKCGFCHSECNKEFCWNNRKYFVLKISNGLKTHFIGYVNETCP
jgi:hypothetical protein